MTCLEVDGGIHGFDGLADTPLAKAFDSAKVTFTKQSVT